MQIGIFGAPRSGKSTLLRIMVAEFGYGIDESKGKKGLFVVNVPDPRVDHLAGVFKVKKKVYRTITLVEIPPGGDGRIDSLNIPLLRDCDLLLLVIPLFLSGVEGVSSGGETAYELFRQIEIDLGLADYLVIQKRLERLVKEGKKPRELQLMEKVASSLESGVPMRDMELRAEEKKMISGFSLLSDIPIIAVVNVSEDDAQSNSVKKVVETIQERRVEAVVVCGKLVEEIMSLDPEDRDLFMREAGIDRSVGETIYAASNRLLNLATFLTVNPNEVRAWGIREGSTAREAAGKIHSDMERGFIKAEVIPFEDFIQFDDMTKAKGAGKVRLEGKDYAVRDGDIVTVRFNV
jgi:GTP-binding protein YchF